MSQILPAGHLAAALLLLLSGPATAQGALGEVGTWEMTTVENSPGDDVVVFTRMTFTGDRLVTTTVTLDPDDGELSALITDDAYIEANGQLIVRAPGSTTVLAVARDAAGLVVRDLRSGVILTLRPADPGEALDPALVGTWSGAGGGHAWRLRFEPDGRSFVSRDGGDDSEEPYTVAGAYLLIDEDAYRFTFAGDRLMLDRENETLELFQSLAVGGVRPGVRPALND